VVWLRECFQTPAAKRGRKGTVLYAALSFAAASAVTGTHVNVFNTFLCSCVFTASATNVDLTTAKAICQSTIPGSHLLTFRATRSTYNVDSTSYVDGAHSASAACSMVSLTLAVTLLLS
jgi:hypothetical protein